MNKAVVTGGAGFIGSSLCAKLIREGVEVAVVDDLSTGRIANLDEVMDHKKFTFYEGSVRDSLLMDRVMDGADAVFHLAAAVGVQLIVDRPVHTIETNIHGTEVVLRTANKYRAKVLVASSSEVYGKSEKVPFSEDDDSVLGGTRFARWGYACSKAIDEFLGFAYFRQFDLPVISARLFNTIGPKQVGQYGMVVPRFVTAALKNEPINIYGNGKQTRCFAYVGDVVDGLVLLMRSEKTAGEVYNIGTQREVSIEQLANIIIEITGSKSEKKFITYEKAYGKNFDDMQRRVPSLEKIKKHVGYEPKTKLEDIIALIVDQYKEKL